MGNIEVEWQKYGKISYGLEYVKCKSRGYFLNFCYKYVLFFILLFVNWAVYFLHFRCAAGRTGSALCPPISCVACFPARQRDRNFNRTNCQLGGSTY